MKTEELLKLLEAIKASDLNEFILETQDVKMILRRGSQFEFDKGLSVPSLPSVQETAPAEDAQKEELIEVLAPMVGTFYRAPSPEAEPFVSLGTKVRPGETLCILEAMKLMNEIDAEVAGEVVEIAATNGQMVEYGQILMTLRSVGS